jgi:hypothetical protein
MSLFFKTVSFSILELMFRIYHKEKTINIIMHAYMRDVMITNRVETLDLLFSIYIPVFSSFAGY